MDGALAATVDTYAATAAYQVQVWAKTWTASGAHTVKVVVSGTAGRPRVDLDAFALLLPSATGTVVGTPLQLLALVPTAAESGAGYDRALFPYPVDADGNGCSTRQEVLAAESRTPVAVGASCALVGGTWLSAYDGVTTTSASALEIDHVVALKEAWDSGAYAWTAARRQAYANDLGDPRTLRAVTTAVNTAKSDSDPAQWLPPLAGFRCAYAAEWVAVKVRWRLSVDAAERAAIQALLGTCPATTVIAIAQ